MATGKTSILELLAKELGYKDKKELKKKLSETGTLKSRLESGQGFGESISGRTKELAGDVREAVSLKGVKKISKKFYMEFFGGQDIFSAYMRGRLNKKEKDADGLGPIQKSIMPTGEEIQTAPTGASEASLEDNAYLRVIAKSALSLHGIARDVNVLRQNIVKLTKIEAEKYNKGKTKKESIEAVTKADAFFLKEDEREAKLENDKQKAMPKKEAPKAPEPAKKAEGADGGGFMSSIMSFFKDGLMGALKMILNPGAILGVLAKVFVIGALLVSLFKGITAAFEKWKETGSLKEAIIEGLGAIVEFLTFGFFGKDTVKNLFDKVEKFLDPIIDSISSVVTTMKDWVVNNIGIPEINIPIPKWVQKLGAPEKFSIGPYYPFKKNPRSTADEVTQRETKPTAPKETTEPPKTSESITTTPTATPAVEKTTAPATAPTPANDPASKAESNKEGALYFLRNVIGVLPKGDGTFISMKDNSIVPEEQVKSQIDAAGKNGEKVISLVKETPPVSAAGGAPAGINAGGTAPSGGEISGTATAASGGDVGAGRGAGAGPSAEGPQPSMPGGEIAAASSDVAEGQRMESTADAGSVINAPTTNNSMDKPSKVKSPASDVYDSDLVELLARA